MSIDMQDGVVAPEDAEAEIRNSFIRHSSELAKQIREKFGTNIDYPILQEIMTNRKYVRYETKILFDSSQVESGLFANTQSKQVNPDETMEEYDQAPDMEYEIVLHEHFKNNPEQIVPLILYQIPVINYGDMATYEQSETFGSAVMGMDQEEYYQLICKLVDSMPS
jgi:hypothetical protein